MGLSAGDGRPCSTSAPSERTAARCTGCLSDAAAGYSVLAGRSTRLSTDRPAVGCGADPVFVYNRIMNELPTPLSSMRPGSVFTCSRTYADFLLVICGFLIYGRILESLSSRACGADWEIL